MIRRNGKKQVVDYDSSIKKSNDFSMAKLNSGLTLNQMQLLAYSIYSAQKNGESSFIKADFEKKFGIDYKTIRAKKDTEKLFELKFSTTDLENDSFDYQHVFQRIRYKEGLLMFKWTDDMLPHILKIKEDKYVLTDLTITAKFKSGFSWILYDYLKAHYGHWHKNISKVALMKLFGVEDRKTYQAGAAQFKRGVLDVAISELNQHTELDVWYTEVKKGRAITGFVLRWSTGDKVARATEGQMAYLREIYDVVQKDMGIYFAFKDPDRVMKAREHIIALNEIDSQASRGFTYKEADEAIVKAKLHLVGLGKLREREESGVMTVPFYNWLVERD